MAEKITIVPYNPEWPRMYEQERRILAETLADFAIRIEHVGSTSVPGLGAKPIIDIMIGMEDASRLDELPPPMLAAGYCYIQYYEDELPFRRYFTRVNGLHGIHYATRPGFKDRKLHFTTHHIHIVPLDSDWWPRHLFFRDYLRNHPAARKEYYRIKMELSKIEWNNRNDYTEAKSEFIQGIEQLMR